MNIHKKTVTTLLLVASLLALGGCAQKTESPESVIKKWKAGVEKIESADMALTLGVKGDDGTDSIDFNLDMRAKADQLATKDQRADIGLRMGGKLNAEGKQASGELNLNVRLLASNLYFYLESLEADDPSAEQFKTLLEPYKKKWQRLPADFLPKPLREFQEKTDETVAKEKALRKLFVETDLLEIAKEYGTEKLDGRRVYHYGVQLNKEGLKRYLKGAAQISGTEKTDAEIDESAAFADLITNMELWIGAEDYHLYKGVVSLSGKELNEDQGRKVNSTISLTFTAKSYNEPLDIQTPEQFDEFNPLSLLMGMQLSGVGQPAMEDGAVDTSMLREGETQTPSSAEDAEQ